MLRLVEYNEKYDAQLQALDSVTYYSVKFHKDVIASSVRLALDGNTLVGVGMLKAGATFLKIEEEDLRYYFIHAEFLADEEADVEIQIDASELLLEDLKNSFNEIQDRYPGRRLILRLWCMSDKTAYQEFLMAHEFRPMRVTPVLVRELTDEDLDVYGDEQDSILELENGETLEIREMNPNKDSFMNAYTVTNREAFEVEDSPNELRFVMGGEDSHVFAVMKGERVIAAVTLWKITDERAATENIFCAADYRHMGITSALLEYAFGFLKTKGYEVASLTVFGDNRVAMQLYFKLGYELEGNMLELHYEKNYVNIGY